MASLVISEVDGLKGPPARPASASRATCITLILLVHSFLFRQLCYLRKSALFVELVIRNLAKKVEEPLRGRFAHALTGASSSTLAALMALCLVRA
jgi:hypothetical protein